MAEVLEYEYGPGHLDESEALDRFAREKRDHPTAVVTLDEQDCGGWTVGVSETPAEKERLIRRRLLDMIDSFLGAVKR